MLHPSIAPYSYRLAPANAFCYLRAYTSHVQRSVSFSVLSSMKTLLMGKSNFKHI